MHENRSPMNVLAILAVPMKSALYLPARPERGAVFVERFKPRFSSLRVLSSPRGRDVVRRVLVVCLVSHVGQAYGPFLAQLADNQRNMHVCCNVFVIRVPKASRLVLVLPSRRPRCPDRVAGRSGLTRQRSVCCQLPAREFRFLGMRNPLRPLPLTALADVPVPPGISTSSAPADSCSPSPVSESLRPFQQRSGGTVHTRELPPLTPHGKLVSCSSSRPLDPFSGPQTGILPWNAVRLLRVLCSPRRLASLFLAFLASSLPPVAKRETALELDVPGELP